VTGNPGEGGTVYSIRNKRIYREFKPKKEWFDYDDQNFDYDVTLSKGFYHNSLNFNKTEIHYHFWEYNTLRIDPSIEYNINNNSLKISGMPWDPEIANKMDSYTNIRFTKEYLRKMR